MLYLIFTDNNQQEYNKGAIKTIQQEGEEYVEYNINKNNKELADRLISYCLFMSNILFNENEDYENEDCKTEDSNDNYSKVIKIIANKKKKVREYDTQSYPGQWKEDYVQYIYAKQYREAEAILDKIVEICNNCGILNTPFIVYSTKEYINLIIEEKYPIIEDSEEITCLIYNVIIDDFIDF